MGDDAQEAAGCPACGTSFSGVHTNPNTMELPDQRAYPEENITSDDEERQREGYDISQYYERRDPTEYALNGDGVSAHVTYESNARIITVNSGIRGRDDDELQGFALCTECNRWLTSYGQIDKHVDDGCYANADEEAIRQEIELYTEGGHDTITITTPLPGHVDPDDAESFYRTLKEALYQGILVEFDLDEQGLSTFLKPAPGAHGDLTIVIHETSEGGSGALHDLTDPNKNRFERAIKEALDVLHVNDADACERACYECLMSYYNQREHPLFDRNLAIPWLRATQSMSLDPIEGGPDREHFEQLLQACESNLERKVLQTVWDEGLQLPDEAQKTIYDGDEPVVEADFYFEADGRAQPVVVFVDGPVHEKEHVRQNDEKKRNRLLRMNYRYISISDPEEVHETWNEI
jgi:hypothetical protein